MSAEHNHEFNGLSLPVINSAGDQMPAADDHTDDHTAVGKKSSVDLAEIREKLTQNRGPQYWKSLEQLADTKEFQEHIKYEFPSGADQMLDPVTRRSFLKVMGASVALAGVSACFKQPDEKIVPFVKAPEQVVPGKPLYYATALTVGGYATGVLVESHLGRPTKVEGNPDHPASLGATDAFTQAEILRMYDPDRSQAVMNRGEISTWKSFTDEFSAKLGIQKAKGGAGLRILSETTASPTLGEQMRQLMAQYPEAKWIQYDAAGQHNTRAGLRTALGRDAAANYSFNKAKIILSLDGDFLAAMPGSVRYARHFANGRRVRKPGDPMNRLYVAESSPTLTGAKADHRMAIMASEIESVARIIASKLGVAGAGATNGKPEWQKWIDAVVKDLQANRGASIVIAGESQPAAVHVVAHAMNQALGNVGTTVNYIEPVENVQGDQLAALRQLAADMEAGNVGVLVMVGGNPVYDAPADLDFAKKMEKVGLRVHLGLYQDETSWLSHWHLPISHALESWGDACAFDGTITIVQPLIAPLYDSKSVHELLAIMMDASPNGYEIVRNYWKERLIGDFEKSWQMVLNDGLVKPDMMKLAAAPAATPATTSATTAPADSAAAPAAPAAASVTAAPAPATISGNAPVQIPPPTPYPAAGMELNFRPDPNIRDGQYANNGWLQELPKPLSLLTWDNAVLISPKTAEEQGLKSFDVVDLAYQGRLVTGPVWVLPGHPDKSVTVYLGYGRERAGRVGTNQGFNAYKLRTSNAPWFGLGLELRKTGEFYQLVTTQDHASIEGRNMYRYGTSDQFQKQPDFVKEMEHVKDPISLYTPYEYRGYAWGMAIDLTACIGCNVCTIACQAENNIPVVGKDQVFMGREMHWIRVDRYYEGGLDNPMVHYQPVPCMQCERASCEVVCPVGATVHSDEGLNDMVYNRCVGTKYCSNNCPYKVRRFNFFQYSDEKTPVVKLGRNPDVTVRNRGVMEKCTYCVQRINHARIDAKREGREIYDGEIKTACEIACPTGAITFGNLNDPKSRVVEAKKSKLNYRMLEELNTEPRTSYLASIRNPNPELAEPVKTENSHA